MRDMTSFFILIIPRPLSFSLTQMVRQFIPLAFGIAFCTSTSTLCLANPCIEATSEPGNPNTGISLSFVAFAESSENEGAYFPVPEEGEALRALSQELPAQSSISDPSIAVRARFPVRELPPSLTLRTLMAPPLARPRSAGSRFRLTPLID